MKNNFVLSIEQMSRLKELGVDTSNASMCWIKDPNGECDDRLVVHDEYCCECSGLDPVPTFTLQDMLEMMPFQIYEENSDKYHRLYIERAKGKVGVLYCHCYSTGDCIFDSVKENILEAAYSTLCWLAENGYLEKEITG